MSFRLRELRARIKPFRLYWFTQLKSTNDHAATMRRQGELFAPAIVLTARQTAGRGRGERSWWSASGSITATFAFPIDESRLPHQIPLIAGLAVRQTAVELTGAHDIQLKWPNDLLWKGRKLAGLLCERIERADLIGIGLNVNLDPQDAPPTLAKQISSLSHISGFSIDLTDALMTLARNLRTALLPHPRPFPEILKEYDQYHALSGKKVRIDNGLDQSIIGRCEGLDSMGRLLVREKTKLHHIISGHVRLA